MIEDIRRLIYMTKPFLESKTRKLYFLFEAIIFVQNNITNLKLFTHRSSHKYSWLLT